MRLRTNSSPAHREPHSERECSASYSHSRADSPREDTGTAGGPLSANAVPVQIYDGFVEPKSDVWRRV